jgi:pantoate--beta-alanine ligase
MGALHAGHTSLIRRSARENPRTVVSVFVNPAQFENATDLKAYPRNLGRDAEQAFSAGADVVFAPAVETVYPGGFSTNVSVSGLTELWEGVARPGHFAGVATVVTILHNMIRPARAYFGEKDFQQLAMIKKLHRDLHLPGEVVGCATLRDADGLALSSRNVRLSGAEREAARSIAEALFAMRARAAGGEHEADRLLAIGRSMLAKQPLLTVDYLAIVDDSTLLPIPIAGANSRAIVAVLAGKTRLIDNLALTENPAPV